MSRDTPARLTHCSGRCLLNHINPSRGLSNALFFRCAEAPTALGQRCDLVHQMRHGLIVHCRS